MVKMPFYNGLREGGDNDDWVWGVDDKEVWVVDDEEVCGVEGGGNEGKGEVKRRENVCPAGFFRGVQSGNRSRKVFGFM